MHLLLAIALLLVAACGGATSSPSTVPEGILIVAPPEGAVVRDDEISVSGTGPVGAEVVLDISGRPDKRTTIGEDRVWSIDAGLTEGRNTLTFRIGDDKSTAVSRTVVYEALTAAASPSREPTPNSTPKPTPNSTPPPKPTATPKPTLRPAALDFGTLSYDPNGCFSSNYRDAEGHNISGVEVGFKLSAKNNGQVKSGHIWLVVQSIDWFDTTPLLFDSSWPEAQWYEIDEKTMMIRGPEVLPGKSRSFSWTVLFVTAFDPHYEVFAQASKVELQPDDVTGDPDAFWDDIWTSNTICF